MKSIIRPRSVVPEGFFSLRKSMKSNQFPMNPPETDHLVYQIKSVSRRIFFPPEIKSDPGGFIGNRCSENAEGDQFPEMKSMIRPDDFRKHCRLMIVRAKGITPLDLTRLYCIMFKGGRCHLNELNQCINCCEDQLIELVMEPAKNSWTRYLHKARGSLKRL